MKNDAYQLWQCTSLLLSSVVLRRLRRREVEGIRKRKKSDGSLKAPRFRHTGRHHGAVELPYAFFPSVSVWLCRRRRCYFRDGH